MKHWLNRSLVIGPYVALVFNQKEFDKCRKDMGVSHCDNDPYCNEGAHATTHSYLSDKGQLACIVAMRPLSERAGIEVAGLLVHEAVHVWQQARAKITYTLDPQRTGGLEAEIEAYAIQNIAQNLMEEFKRRMK